MAAWLRSLPEQALTELLERRRDLLHRPPTSLDDLAGRLSSPQAVAGGLQQLDRTAVQVGAVLSAIGGRAEASAVADALGRSGPIAVEVVEAALCRLAEVGLAWPSAGGTWRSVAGLRHQSDPLLGLAPPLRRLMIGVPLYELRGFLDRLGLGGARSTHDAIELLAGELEDRGRLQQLFDTAPPEVRALAVELSGNGYGSLCDGSTAEAWLLDRMLLLVGEGGSRSLCRELTVLVRGDRLVGQVRREPERTWLPAAPATTAAERALALVEDVRSLLDACEAAPPKVLQSGGVGVQAQRRLGKATDKQTEYVAWLLDLAGEARLLGTLGSAGRLTTQARQWRALDAPAAYVALVRAVLDSPAGPRPEVGEPPAPLAGYRYPDPALLPLPLVLAGAAQPTGEADDSLLAWLDWRHYRPGAAGLRRLMLQAQLHQLELLGLRADGACAPWAGPLLDGDDVAAEAALAAALPPAQDDAVFQADGTAFVAGRASSGLRALLDVLGRREGERTWRLSADGVRQALDDGRDGRDVLEEMRRRSRHPLPQVLEQLVLDVAARHGRVQVFEASTLLRIDDVPLSMEVLRDKRLKALALSEVQPGVLSSPKPASTVLAALRSAGHAPVGHVAGDRPTRPVAARRPTVRYEDGFSAAELAARLRKARPAGR